MPLRLAKPKKKDAATRFAEWLADTFVIPGGISAGQPLQLHNFQLDFARAYLAEDDDGPINRTLVFSLPRKTGKSTFMATLLLGRGLPDSPIYRPNFKAVCVAPTAKFAGFVPQAAIDIMQAVDRGDEIALRHAPSPGKLVWGTAQCQLLSGDGKSGHGDDVDLAILDEAGLVPRRQDELFDATFNSLAARNGSQILTGTRLDSPRFGEIIDRPALGTYVQLHAADKDADPSDPKEWERATPGGFKIKSKSFIRDAFARAEASDSLEDFKTSHLNLPGNPSRELLLQYDVLRRAYRDDPQIIDGEPVHIGLDLGGSSSMTAATIAYEASGVIKVIGAFPTGEINLLERGKRDAVHDLWVRCAAAGELKETSGAVSDLGEFFPDLIDLIGNHPVASLSCDRYRQAELQTAMARAKLNWPVIYRGQGPRDGDADIRATRRLFIAGMITLKRSVLLEAALAESDVKRAATGASQLDKSHATARIDVATSLVLACSALLRARDTIPAEYEVTVL
ncbi:terminase TerL endonuclease subunit [Sulfitobacter dubius]|uniref:terminase TerL endonuclease subunit n=1 Tax=Sulfitobacter dubius TaxID=218673 RepID=UPI002943EF26|nr:terminase TerL endonuclease subunit [Sulfitobacter dubius]WOI29569.1 terminase TerL endonuclease subunit [Sulfitobacter dubius]